MDDALRNTIHELVTEFLDKLEVTAEFSLVEEDGAIIVRMETEEPGVLIGHHGRSLEAIQVVLGQLVYKKLGQWVRIVVTVGDYRERRNEQLKELAQKTAERVIETQSEMVLSDLTPGERRIVHMALSEHPQVVSGSQGEGKNRHLIVSLRGQKTEDSSLNLEAKPRTESPK